jgi:hypothetical protein
MDNEPEIDRFGNKRWILNGAWHREDGPAAEYVDGDKYWYLNNNLHRVDGPAIEQQNGNNHWFLNDISYTFDEWLEANNFISEEEKVMLKLTHG